LANQRSETIIIESPDGSRQNEINGLQLWFLEQLAEGNGKAIYTKDPRTGRLRLTDEGGEAITMLGECMGVYEVLAPTFSDDEKAHARRIKQKPQMTPHSAGVYILKSLGGLYKIGCSKDLAKRMSALWSVIPEEFEIFAFAPTREFRPSERYLHSEYQSKRVRGEWFALTEDDIIRLLETYEFILVNKPITSFLQELSPRRNK